MKINQTLKLTLLLLLIMSGAGTASAYLAYQAGTQALKGVSQPENNPTKKLGESSKKSNEPTEFKPIDEKTILIRVYDHTHKKNQAITKKEQESKKNNTEDKTTQSKRNDSPDVETSQYMANFPMQVQDQGVKLEIQEASNEGTNLSFKINLQNQGTTSVKFLYSFLEVKDSEGRALSAITEGLPEELPPNSENFAGKVKIPSALVDDSQALSFNLTDYPDQKLQLNIPQIPVIR
ncbi:hypothetical protein [Crocosphaera sp. Alani8]|uniref:hypothetical protein n=1 Tax=Crocosphaera sp. Alani8 TaxID=3038952 RepID=UPI00313BF852